MAAIMSLRNSYIEIKDAAAHQILVKVGEGNLTYDRKQVVEYILNRGRLDSTRQGDDVPMDVSFQFQWEWIKTQTGHVITVEDAICQLNAASGWTSTGAACEPYAVDIVVVHDVDCGTAHEDEQIILTQFRWESISHDVKAGTCSVSGKCNVTAPTVYRSAYTPPTETVGS